MHRKQILLLLIVTGAILMAVIALNGAPALAAPRAQATATPAPAKLDQVFVTLAPAAGGPLRLVTLTLKADGKAELTLDPIGQEPAVTQSGTWKASGDTLTVSLTGDGGKTMTLVFKQTPEVLTATEFDKTIFGANGFKMFQRDVVETKIAALARAYISLDLQAGFPLDPFFVSVNGGGELDASLLDAKCRGFINGNPTLSLNWSGKAEVARVFTFSDADPMLVVQTPDGKFLCGDDSNPLVLDPQVEIKNPSAGKYNIWVGSASKNQLLPTILVLTTRADVNASNFQLSSLVKRPALPPENTTAPHALQAKIITDAIARYKGTPGGPLDAAPLKQAVSSAGTIPVFDIDLGGARCNGYVADTPDYVFDVPNGMEQFAVWFEGKQDASLLVVGPNGAAFCNDDSAAGNANPQLLITKPAPGKYAVFIGRLNQDAPAQGTIVVTTDAKATPSVLPASK